MALRKEWLMPVARTLVKHGAAGPVYVLGDQVTYFTYEYARRKLSAAGLLRNPSAPVVASHQNPRMVSLQTVLGMLGLEEFNDVDLNGRAALSWDLSRPLPPGVSGKAGVVIDFGTCEHIFNLSQAFSNIVDLLRPGGTVMHLSPVTWYNHGLVNFNPIWFKEFYAHNHFELLDHYLILAPFQEVFLSSLARLGLTCRYFESGISAVSFLVNDEGRWLTRLACYIGMVANTIFLFVGRKSQDGFQVSFPIQSVYRQEIAKALPERST